MITRLEVNVYKENTDLTARCNEYSRIKIASNNTLIIIVLKEAFSIKRLNTQHEKSLNLLD